MSVCAEERATFLQCFESLYASKFTGAVLVHLGQGVPNRVQPLVADREIVLDKTSTKGAHLTR